MQFILYLLAIVILISLSAICSGLNISLMSLGIADLQRKAKLGNPLAIKILPLRKNSNLSLASILLTNVAVISATSLVLNHLFSNFNHVISGVTAGIVSTLLVVLFGEVLPQSYFTRNKLKLTGRFVSLLRILIVITYPIAKPLEILLNRLFGHEHTPLQNRKELGIMFAEHMQNKDSDLDEDEVEIIQGALTLSQKRARDILTPIQLVQWLTPEQLIDKDKFKELRKIGRSRIPVFSKDLTVNYGVLLLRDLIDFDFDNKPTHVKDLPLYKNRIIGSRTALDTLFRRFIAARTHLLPVEKDDRIIGIVTIEDLIEEIVGHEILDETDRQMNRA